MGDGIKVNPEGFDDIVKKYNEQVERDTQDALKRRGVKDPAELEQASQKAMEAQARRQPHTTLRDHKVILNPEAKAIGDMRSRLDEEIKGLFQKATTPQEALKTLRERNIKRESA